MTKTYLTISGFVDFSDNDNFSNAIFCLEPGFREGETSCYSIDSFIEDILIDWQLGYEPFTEMPIYYSKDSIMKAFEESKTHKPEERMGVDNAYFSVTLCKMVMDIEGVKKCCVVVTDFQGNDDLKLPYALYEVPDDEDWTDYDGH